MRGFVGTFFLFNFLLLHLCSCHSPEKKIHDDTFDTLKVDSAASRDFLMNYNYHFYEDDVDTDILLNFSCRANKRLDSIHFSNPHLIDIDKNGDTIYRKDSLRDNILFSGNVHSTFSSGHFKPPVSICADSLFLLKEKLYDLAGGRWEYRFHYCGHVRIGNPTDTLYSDDLVCDLPFRKIYCRDTVHIKTEKESITGFGFESEDIFLYHYMIRNPISITLIPDENH
jgi:hypothetical protein